jgi:hypothetical protein
MRRQEFCRHCKKNTLHELDPDPVNHILHLLLTLFCIGLWLPIWILIALTAPRRRMRCSTCGQIVGAMTVKELEEDALYRAENAARRKEAISYAANVAAKTTGRALGTGVSAIWAGIRIAVSAVVKAIAESFKQADRVFRKMADGDEFMVWFFWSVLTVAILLVGTVVVATLIQLRR